MIKTKFIIPNENNKISGYLTIDFSKSPWDSLSPHKLTTDGNEENHNTGGILFTNFYEGSKVYSAVFAHEVSSLSQDDFHGITWKPPDLFNTKFNAKKIWWKYKPINEGCDILINASNDFKESLYFYWRNLVWHCSKPLLYPNKYINRETVQFSLVVNAQGNWKKLNHLSSRKEIYVKEYIRLVRKTEEYKKLLEFLKNGRKLLFCENEVPMKFKKGCYGKFVESDGTVSRRLTLEILNELMNDTSESFGFSLCLALALLTEL